MKHSMMIDGYHKPDVATTTIMVATIFKVNAIMPPKSDPKTNFVS